MSKAIKTLKQILDSDTYGFQVGSAIDKEITSIRSSELPNRRDMILPYIFTLIVAVIIISANYVAVRYTSNSNYMYSESIQNSIDTAMQTIDTNTDAKLEEAFDSISNKIDQLSTKIQALQETTETNHKTTTNSGSLIRREIYGIDESVPLAGSISIPEARLNPIKNTIQDGDTVLQEYILPADVYGDDLNISEFMPYMDYKLVTLVGSGSYTICHSENAYTDIHGLRRYRTTDDQYTVNGKDDYVVAMGNFYKEKGHVGDRYLIVTTNGDYTVIVGDEKGPDGTADPLEMYGMCGDNPNVLEFVVDESLLHEDILINGTVTNGPIEELGGEIISIYKIQ